jgi:T5SS/PEP-CTERM-associated repeat protein
MNLARRMCVCSLALVAAVLIVRSTSAVTSSWTVGSGSFITAANWNNGVPDTGDVAVFDRGSGVTYTVTFSELHSADVTNDRLVVGSNTVTFNPALALPADYFLANPTTTEAHPVLFTPVRGLTIGAEANDTAAVLVSHLSILQAVAATLGHAAGSDGALTLNQNGDQFNVTGAGGTNPELIVGRLGSGTIDVSNGADVNVSSGSGDAVLGEYAGSQGNVDVSGSGSTLNIGGTLIIGGGGSGALSVNGGATLHTGGRLTIGGGVSGALNVTSGGDVVADADSYVGPIGGSSGVVTVDGAGSTWSVAGFLYLRNEGDAQLNISNGGQVTSGNAYIGDVPGTSAGASINGGGSKFTTTFSLSVSGTMNVENNGAVKVGDVLYVDNFGAVNLDTATIEGEVENHGLVNITGPTTISDSLTTAVNAETIIDPAEPVATSINIGGPVLNSGAFTMHVDSVTPCCSVTLDLPPGQTFVNNATGVVNLNGPNGLSEGTIVESKHIIAGNVVNQGEFHIRTNTHVQGSLTTAVNADTIVDPAEPVATSIRVDGAVANSGTFTLKPASVALCCTASVELGAGETFTNNATGIVKGAGVIDGNVVNHGRFEPGNSSGVVTVTGDYTQADDGQLRIVIAGTIPGSQYDQLAIGGAVDLDGLVEVAFADGFTPQPGDRFDVITAADVDGEFSDAFLPGLPQGMFWDIDYGAGLVSLSTVTLPGDFDADEDVDSGDLAQWRGDFGVNGDSDADSDGDSDGADFLAWQQQFGRGPSSPPTSPVPEPAALWLVLTALAPALRRAAR